MNHLCECFGHFIFEVTTILGVDLAEEVVMGWKMRYCSLQFAGWPDVTLWILEQIPGPAPVCRNFPFHSLLSWFTTICTSTVNPWTSSICIRDAFGSFNERNLCYNGTSSILHTKTASESPAHSASLHYWETSWMMLYSIGIQCYRISTRSVLDAGTSRLSDGPVLLYELPLGILGMM